LVLTRRKGNSSWICRGAAYLNQAMHADTQPRRECLKCFFEVHWRRGCAPVMAGVSAQAPALVLALVVCSPLPSVMSQLSALPVLACRCSSLSRPSVLPFVRAARRRGARLSLPLARIVVAQPVSLPHVRRSVALGGPWGRKSHPLPSRSASSSGGLWCRSAAASPGGSSWCSVGSWSAPASGLLTRLSAASGPSNRVGAKGSSGPATTWQHQVRAVCRKSAIPRAGRLAWALGYP
jgi:hypothetical protein